MGRYAVLNNKNVVTNVIEWDGEAKWSPPDGHFVRPHEQCAIGDIWMGDLDDFVRPLKELLAPEDESSLAERSQMFEQAKSRFKTGMTFITPTGAHEPV